MTKMRAALVLALALLLLRSPLPAAAAEDERQLVVGVEELDYFPIFAVADGAYIGAAREILDAFAEDAGYRLTYRPLPVRRLYAELASGGIDLKFPDNPGWNPKGRGGGAVVFSAPVIEYVDGTMVRPERVGRGAAAVRALGTVAGFTPFAWLDRLEAGEVRLTETAQFPLLLQQAMLERVDGAYANVAVALNQLGRLGRSGALVFDPGLPHSRDSYMLSTTTRFDAVAAFDRWLADNRARVAEIQRRTGAAVAE